PAAALEDEDVHEHREDGPVGEHAREADLLGALVESEGERARDRALHDVARDVLRPVRADEEAVHDVEVEAPRIGADGEAPTGPLADAGGGIAQPRAEGTAWGAPGVEAPAPHAARRGRRPRTPSCRRL